MEQHIPKLETCRECGGHKSTVWEETGFTIKQTHKAKCSILAELKARYPETYYPPKPLSN